MLPSSCSPYNPPYNPHVALTCSPYNPGRPFLMLPSSAFGNGRLHATPSNLQAQRLPAFACSQVQALHPAHTAASIQALLPRFKYFDNGSCIVHHIFGGEVRTCNSLCVMCVSQSLSVGEWLGWWSIRPLMNAARAESKPLVWPIRVESLSIPLLCHCNHTQQE